MKTVTVQIQLELRSGQTVSDIEHEQLQERVLSIARFMEQKGYVRHEIYYDDKVRNT